MKNNFKYYILIWAVFFIAWCSIVFIVRPIMPAYEIRYDARFWVSFLFIVATFIGNLLCAYIAFKAEDNKKMFLNMPLITISWVTLIIMLIAGSRMMLIPDFPAWITAIICIVIFAFNVTGIVKVVWATSLVESVDEKVRTKTSFIKLMQIEVESIMNKAKKEDIKSECKKLYDAIRYSDPMSNSSTLSIEDSISMKIKELSTMISINDVNRVEMIVDELIILIDKRNSIIKVSK